MPDYIPTDEEHKAYIYCVRNNIRISPGGANDGRYTIDVSLDGKKWNKSPKTFDKHEIWEIYYNYCRYYYDKRKT